MALKKVFIDLTKYSSGCYIIGAVTLTSFAFRAGNRTAPQQLAGFSMVFQGLYRLVYKAGKASLMPFMLDHLEERLHNCRVKMGTGLFPDIVADFLLRPGIPIRPV
jgi:hypothetical protein